MKKVINKAECILLLCFLYSCSEKQEQDNTQKILATIEEGSYFNWQTNDAVGLWLAESGEENSPFTCKTADGRTGLFEGNKQTTEKYSTVTAFYPYSEECKFNTMQNTITVTLPASQEQNYNAIGNKDFDEKSKKYHFMVAKAGNQNGNNMSATFKAAMAFIDFNIKNAPAKQVVYSATLRIQDKWKTESPLFPLQADINVDDASVNVLSAYRYISSYVAEPVAGNQRLRLALFPNNYSGHDFAIDVLVDDGSAQGACYTFTHKGLLLKRNTIYDIDLDFTGAEAPTKSAAYTTTDFKLSYGPSTQVGATTWAPVNCGFEDYLFRYGKLYQWGRAQGFGYYDPNNNGDPGMSDFPERTNGAYDNSKGENNPDSKLFYTLAEDEYNYVDWITPSLVSADNLINWNQLSKTYGEKFSTPCPKGWRVPSREEMEELASYPNSIWWKNNNKAGVWMGPTASNENPYDGQNIFMEAIGFLNVNSRPAARNMVTGYWSGDPSPEDYVDDDTYGQFSWTFHLAHNDKGNTLIIRVREDPRTAGLAVRCVRE